MRSYFLSQTSCAAEKFIFGIGSSPIALSRASSLRKRSISQLPLTQSSGWLGYLIASPRSMITMFMPTLTMRSVSVRQTFSSNRTWSAWQTSFRSSPLYGPQEVTGWSLHMLVPMWKSPAQMKSSFLPDSPGVLHPASPAAAESIDNFTNSRLSMVVK